jgi:hypothetical protein
MSSSSSSTSRVAAAAAGNAARKKGNTAAAAAAASRKRKGERPASDVDAEEDEQKGPAKKAKTKAPRKAQSDDDEVRAALHSQ